MTWEQLRAMRAAGFPPAECWKVWLELMRKAQSKT